MKSVKLLYLKSKTTLRNTDALFSEILVKKQPHLYQGLVIYQTSLLHKNGKLEIREF